MREAVIVSMARTPVGKCRGKLAPVPPEQLGAVVLKRVCEDIDLDTTQIDEVIMGNLWAHDIAGMGRVALLEAGLPVTIPSLRIDRQCSSALDSIALAAMFVQTGHGDIVIGGGAESDSRRPYVMFKNEVEYSVKPPVFLTQYKASTKAIGDPFMGVTAENLAEQYGITRQEMDEYSAESHQKAEKAWQKGYLAKNVVPVKVSTKKGFYIFDKDETVRPETTVESLSKLPALFKKEDGKVTAGNSCPMSDGASAAVIMSMEKATELGLTPLAKYVDWAAVGVDPNYMGIGPAFAIRKLLKQVDLTLDDIDLFEINEAFASQTLACVIELGLDKNKLNIDGGAIALGHPLGATGGVLALKLINQLRRENKRYGIAAFCCGGGQGAAVLFENINVK
ncbi:thiolase family protein [Sinanaerobacter chloroacetimidivorans]|jgi:acetyl-CoA C-acetyltransferase|uniref:Acetyl-CoA acetyltransferase n=1 Tax=Sinanaerobacter chloroacetimidivorans TaxID=2818044 RepID=A0A8J8B1T6_9FIRM|nr:thiolase family protein [Sinanaerobacter chloroacetimidivorans]MBR0598016.1 thiolase family protein [Sinanaerobacter chloroacetimidivorans]